MDNRSWGICTVDRLEFNQIGLYHTSHLLKWISWGLPSWLNVLMRHRGQIVCYWKCIPVKSKWIKVLQFRSLLTQFQVIWHWNFIISFFEQLSHWTKMTESCLNVYAKLAAEMLCHSCSATRAMVTTAVPQELSLLSLLQRLSHCHYHKSSVTPAEERWKLMVLTLFEHLNPCMTREHCIPLLQPFYFLPIGRLFFYFQENNYLKCDTNHKEILPSIFRFLHKYVILRSSC